MIDYIKNGRHNYIPKYNLCPLCKEKIVVYEPRCYKCGYDFNSESAE